MNNLLTERSMVGFGNDNARVPCQVLHRPTDEKYSESIPEFEFRLKVKAGITGYAQVYGKYNTTPIDKLKLDLIYIERYSFLLDVKLMLLTLRIIFSKDSTEGVESGQTNALKKEDT